jgi:TolA-binding protein
MVFKPLFFVLVILSVFLYFPNSMILAQDVTPSEEAHQLYMTGNELEEQQNLGEAKTLYSRVIEEYPNSAFAAGANLHLLRADVIARMTANPQISVEEDINRAKSDFAGHPDMPWFLYGIANQYEQQKNNGEAKQIYQDILQEYSQSSVAAGAALHSSRYSALDFIEDGNDEAVQAEISRISSSFPHHPDLAWFYLSIADQYEQMSKRQEAKGIYQQVLRRFTDAIFLPGTTVGFVNYAKLQVARLDICALIDNGDIDGADILLSEMKNDFASDPMLPDAIFRTAEVVYQRGLSEDGLAGSTVIQRGREIVEKDVLEKTTDRNLTTVSYVILATTYFKHGDYEKAIQVYTDYYLFDPNELDKCLFAIALCQEKKGDSAEAIRNAYQIVIDNCPDSAFAVQAEIKLAELNNYN